MQNDLSGHYILTSDIDMTGLNFSPIGNNSTPFSGIFDGNGHTISNLTINRPMTRMLDYSDILPRAQRSAMSLWTISI